jgi:hypothetical protein
MQLIKALSLLAATCLALPPALHLENPFTHKEAGFIGEPSQKDIDRWRSQPEKDSPVILDWSHFSNPYFIHKEHKDLSRPGSYRIRAPHSR